jgi:hypothetical protein
MCLVIYVCLLYLNSHMFVYGGGSGRGLAPARGHLIQHMTTYEMTILYMV